MPIPVECPDCKSRFTAPDAFANRKAKCPKCSAVVKIGALPAKEPAKKPATVAAASKPRGSKKPVAKAQVRAAAKPPTASPKSSMVRRAKKQVVEKQPTTKKVDREALAKRMLDGFTGPIEQTTSTIGYKICVVAVALLMVFLTFVYLGFILFVSYLLLAHASGDSIFGDVFDGEGGLIGFIFYVAPIIVGTILVFFMIKPLFARSAEQHQLCTINRKDDPLLFAFVDKICETVGSPYPARIDIDCQVNASAGFRRGLWSMFSNDLVLTIGLPLVAGLNTRQFAGVLAHEFGHFSQKAGMRLSYLIRYISGWFERVVFERDGWDEGLKSAASTLGMRVGIVLWISMFFVFTTRIVLGILWAIGNTVGGFLLRAMEFDADQYEARVAGSRTFENTTRRMPLLGVGMQISQMQLNTSFTEGRLVDNLPALVLMHAKRLPEEDREKIRKQIEETETNLWDSHPCDSDRIENVNEDKTEGVFAIEEPATILFTDFEAQSKAVTINLYRGVFADALKPGMIRPYEEFAKESARLEAGDKSLMPYTQGLFRAIRPLPLKASKFQRPTDPKAHKQIVVDARIELTRVAPAARDLLEKIDKAHEKIGTAICFEALRRAGFKLKSKDIGDDFSTPEKARVQRTEAERDLKTLGRQMAEADDILGRRLLAALELLQLDRIATRIPDGLETRERLNDILPAMIGLQKQMRRLIVLQDDFLALTILLSQLDGSDITQKYKGVVLMMSERCSSAAFEVSTELAAFRYPFAHHDKETTLGGFLLAEKPKQDDVIGIYEAVSEMMERLASVQARGVSEIALVAQQVEQVIGLGPLPEPPKPKEEDEDE